MAEVCLVGEEGTNLQYELLSRETSRNALAAYDIRVPFANSIAVDTVSLGAAVALLNDLNWYLIRFVESAFIKEPSVSEREWLSRKLATAIREDRIDSSESDRFLKVYGLLSDEDDSEEMVDTEEPSPPRLVEPMLVTRTGDIIPEYDLREVDDTVIVRLTESEFGA